MKLHKIPAIFLIGALCLFSTACSVSENFTPDTLSNIDQPDITIENYSQEQSLTESNENLDTSDKNPQTSSDNEETTMPEPFDLPEPSSGEHLRDFTEEYVFRFENLTSDILNLVPQDDFSQWIDNHHEKKIASEERIPPLTVLEFVTEFDISKEQLLSVIAEDNDPSWTITREDVDVIYSGDMELINRTFVNEYSVLHNNRIYTPEWLYNHTAAEYIEEGLSDNEVSYVMEKMNNLPFIAEAKNAIQNKYREFQELIKEAESENEPLTGHSIKFCVKANPIGQDIGLQSKQDWGFPLNW